MEIISLGSSSNGNAYKVSDGSSTLLLDAGLPVGRLKEKFRFRLSQVDAVLVTHEHKDHAEAVKDLLNMGIQVYASQGTFEAIGVCRGNIIQAGNSFRIGSFEILPFSVIHDAVEPLGFLLQSNVTKEKLLYVTDTAYVPYNFRGLTHIMMEVNYVSSVIAESVESGLVPASLARRVKKTHMSLDNALTFLKENTGPELEEVWLLHLSDENSDERLIKQSIQRIVGVPVYVAGK